MIIFITLLLLTVLGIYIAKKSYDYEFLGVIVSLIFGLYLIIHGIMFFTVSYEYENWLVKRNAFEETLKECRENGRDIEAAAILKEVSEFNKTLARARNDKKYFFTKDYIDDRVFDIDFIK